MTEGTLSSAPLAAFRFQPATSATSRCSRERKLMGMAGMKDMEPDARADVIKEARQLLNREPSKYAAASR